MRAERESEGRERERERERMREERERENERKKERERAERVRFDPIGLQEERERVCVLYSAGLRCYPIGCAAGVHMHTPCNVSSNECIAVHTAQAHTES
jgi:hypothetical protein